MSPRSEDYSFLPLVMSHGGQLCRVSLKTNQIRKITPKAWVYSYINILEKARGVKEELVTNLNKSRVVYNKSLRA